MKHCRPNPTRPIRVGHKKGVLAAMIFVLATALWQPAAALTLFAPTSGSLNSAATPGFIARATAMYADANHRGTADQLGEAARLYPTASEHETLRIEQALNAMTLPGADAEALLDAFLRDYPASAWRNTALAAVADVLFDRGDYADALQAYARVNIDGLDTASANDVLYHRAYCLLKLSDYDQAAAIYATLERTADYTDEARFYQGYIAYAKGDYNTAANLFRSVHSATLPAAMADFYLAQINYASADYRDAAANAKKILDSHSASHIDPAFIAEMNRIEGESLYRLGDTATAMTYLNRYVDSTDSPQPSALYLLGLNDYEAGRYEEAIRKLTPVSTDDSAMGQSAFLYIGQSYLKLGNYNAATLALDKASRMDYDRKVQEAAFFNLAVAGMQGGKMPFGSSVALLEEFLRRYPNSVYAPEAADYVISGYMTDNNYPAALEAIQRIPNPGPKVLAAKQKVLYTLGTRELQADRAPRALTYLSEAASMTGYDAATAADALLWKGEAQFKTGDYTGAVKSLNSYLKQNNGSNYNRALAYYDLGYARLALKNHKEAKADFQKFIDKSGASADKAILADAYNRMADAQYYLSDFSGAASTYSKAYSTNPASGDYPMYQQGIMRGLQRDYRGKIEHLTSMMTTFPQSALIPAALFETGESYGELGDHARAIETYTALATRYPATSQGRQAQLMLAITYLNQGKKQQAIDHYKRVIADYPTSDEARVATDDLKQLLAEQGRVNDYVEFINSIDNAPKPETAELARLTLVSAEKALEANRLGEAHTAATEVITKYPDSPYATDAMVIKAEVETRQNRTTDAMSTYALLESRASTPADVNRARMGMLRLSRDLGNHDTTIEMADKLLESSILGEAGKREVKFTKALALSDSGKTAEAIEIWTELADDIDDLYGTKSQFNIAQTYADKGNNTAATDAVNRLIDANPPHDYWLARGFILLSDLLRRKGNTFEADEYLRSLRENYPGNEADIFRMIDERLKK